MNGLREAIESRLPARLLFVPFFGSMLLFVFCKAQK
jgi:hypothetical protein